MEYMIYEGKAMCQAQPSSKSGKKTRFFLQGPERRKGFDKEVFTVYVFVDLLLFFSKWIHWQLYILCEWLY